MRTTIGFWQLPPDETALFAFLRSTETLVARRHMAQSSREDVTFSPLTPFRRQNFGVLVICRQVDLASVRIYRQESQGQTWYGVDVDPSPVLTYAREPLNRRVLYRSSLGAALDYVDLDTGKRLHKPLEFKRWAKSIVAWIDQYCTERCKLHGFAYPATPAVKIAVDAGKIELRN
jgi:hypothetical protein